MPWQAVAKDAKKPPISVSCGQFVNFASNDQFSANAKRWPPKRRPQG
jgi:hypothetical protein